MTPAVYDAGALIAADRNDRRMWAEHRVRLEMGLAPAVPAPVLAQVSRSPKQVQLRRLLVGCDVVALGEQDAHAVGRILAASRTSDVVDASVLHLAIRRRADVVTSDAKDVSRLAAAVGARVRVLDI